jgi:hypothetical protein
VALVQLPGLNSTCAQHCCSSTHVNIMLALVAELHVANTCWRYSRCACNVTVGSVYVLIVVLVFAAWCAGVVLGDHNNLLDALQLHREDALWLYLYTFGAVGWKKTRRVASSCCSCQRPA